MRVDPNPIRPTGAEAERTESKNNAVAQRNRPGVQGADVARLAEQEQLQLLQAEAAKLPEVRQDRVAAAQQLLDDGSLDARNDQVADALLTELSDSPFNRG